MRMPMKTGKIIPEMPELISRTPEIVPNACANQREAIASSPGKCMRGFLPRPALPRTAGYRLALVCACIGYYFRCPAYQFRHLRYDLPGLHGHPHPLDWDSMGYGDPRGRVPVDRV